ncbi:Hpt domain-containing protein [Caulobacter sp. NIBR2454]|uniref:Hpt domain-containing protein n=1 Tax=Caulobacter sp. NIBR2454 TaxID=3015996 RepID=UPI0022B64266|nr:Hpt domain-containing protein [Caulobacter sp. NIBR2454]
MGQTQAKAEIIQVPNLLRAKVGGGNIDKSAIAKAEAALQALSSNFGQWLQDEIDKLEVARKKIDADGMSTETIDGLYLRAHDLKGLGSTYEYPLITRLAGSLCRLIDEPEKRMKAPLRLIDAHILAIKAAVRDGIKVDTHPLGKALASELESQVTQALA